MKGEEGSIGEPGLTGAKGEPGETGLPGIPGADGLPVRWHFTILYVDKLIVIKYPIQHEHILVICKQASLCQTISWLLLYVWILNIHGPWTVNIKMGHDMQCNLHFIMFLLSGTTRTSGTRRTGGREGQNGTLWILYLFLNYVHATRFCFTEFLILLNHTKMTIA